MKSDTDERPLRDRDLRDTSEFLRAAGWAMFGGFFMGGAVGYAVGRSIVGVFLGAVLGSVVFILVAYGFTQWAGWSVSSAFEHMLANSDRDGTGESYSHIEALEAKGDIAGALAKWEEAIAASPNALAARINGADLYSRKAANHTRAVELFREVQRHAKVPDETKLYVTQRLIDLYLGPVNDEGRALVELRRVVEHWPGRPEANGARSALANIKAKRNRLTD